MEQWVCSLTYITHYGSFCQILFTELHSFFVYSYRSLFESAVASQSHYLWSIHGWLQKHRHPLVSVILSGQWIWTYQIGVASLPRHLTRHRICYSFLERVHSFVSSSPGSMIWDYFLFQSQHHPLPFHHSSRPIATTKIAKGSFWLPQSHLAMQE